MSNAKIIAELEIVGVDQFSKDINQSVKETQKLTATVKEVGNVGSTAFEEISSKGGSLKSQLRAAKQAAAETLIELNRLKDSGKGSATEIANLEQKFKGLTAQAGQLDDAIKDASAAISQAGSDTRGIDIAIRGLTTMSAGFQLVEGGAALFGKESEELQKTLIKLNAIMAVTNALQQIGQELTREDSILTNAASKAKAAYAFVVGTSTGAMKLFRVALAATGIGLIIPLIAALVANFDKIGEVLFKIFPSLKQFGGSFSEIKDKVVSFVKNGLLTYVNSLVEVYNTSLFARQAVAAIGATFKSVGDVVLTVAKNTIAVFKTLYKAITNPREIVSTLKEGFGAIVDNYKNLGKNVVDNYTSGFDNAKKSQLNKLSLDDFGFGSDSKAAKDSGSKAGSKYVEGFVEEVAKIESIGITKLREQLKLAEETFNKLVDVQVQSGAGVKGNPILTKAAEDVQALRDNVEKLENEINRILLPEQSTQSIEPIKVDKIEMPKVDNLKVNVGKLVLNTDKVETESNKGKAAAAIFGINREDFKEEVDYRLAIATKFFDSIAKLSQSISGTISAFSQNILQAETQQYDGLRAKGLISERNYQRQMAAIKNDAARRQRRAEIAQAAVNIPIAILSAFTSTPGGVVIKSIAAAIAGGFAAAQLAAIIKKPIPQFYKGTKKAPPGFKWVGEQGAELINDKGGYAILNNSDSNKLVDMYDKYDIPYKNTNHSKAKDNSINIERAIERANYKLIKKLSDRGVIVENIGEFAELVRVRKYV